MISYSRPSLLDRPKAHRKSKIQNRKSQLGLTQKSLGYVRVFRRVSDKLTGTLQYCCVHALPGFQRSIHCRRGQALPLSVAAASGGTPPRHLIIVLHSPTFVKGISKEDPKQFPAPSRFPFGRASRRRLCNIHLLISQSQPDSLKIPGFFCGVSI